MSEEQERGGLPILHFADAAALEQEKRHDRSLVERHVDRPQ
ncbi:hypothetical protein [Sphingomonas glaciei]|uniref:Uncharacterized protein n=1 Tax=Sphingomonas glaciei TaxID=2938948 RepID=A0ABY5MUF0_9SPHN|nr:hypothetical protein [Sphingomonas glaciei]UUR07350.1 hypothetical protein M1K48_10405 [Sphingomonas glaciei]